MTLKNGKFYNDAGEVVPLEHGNIEQFAILDKIRKRREAFGGDGIKLEPVIKFRAEVYFSCICGQANLQIHSDGIDELDAEESLVGAVDSCPKCKQKYELWNGDLGEIVVKFKK